MIQIHIFVFNKILYNIKIFIIFTCHYKCVIFFFCNFSKRFVFCKSGKSTLLRILAGRHLTKQEVKVKVHYHGILIPNGNVVDTSNKDGGGEPVTIPLSSVIPGWKEGLQLMTEGSTATIICPCNLAYGDDGATEIIPPGSTLQFDIELIEIVQ